VELSYSNVQFPSEEKFAPFFSKKCTGASMQQSKSSKLSGVNPRTPREAEGRKDGRGGERRKDRRREGKKPQTPYKGEGSALPLLF
jgi:hypothetical protein